MLFGATLMTLFGLKALLTAVEVREMIAISRLTITQRKRYGWIAQGVVMMMALPVVSIAMYGPDTYWTGIMDYWHNAAFIGNVIAIINIIAITTPVLATLAAYCVYRKPAELAHWSRRTKGYVYTADIRAGVKNPQRAWIYKWVDYTDPEHPIVRKEYRDDT